MYRIASIKDRDDLHAKYGSHGGVYRLHCLEESRSERIVEVGRVLGFDSEGILYIGKTPAGLGRIGDLIKSLSPTHKSLGHHAVLRYAKNPKFSEKFPFERLCVSFIPADDPATAEREMIRKYFENFGEVPPLNANEP